MSEKISNNGFIYKTIDKVIGVKYIQGFREDFKRIYEEKSTKFRRWSADKRELQREALDAAKRAKQSKWDKYSFWLSVVAIATAVLPVIPTAISILGVVISVITGFRRAAVEVLLYENPYQLRGMNNVKFACAWNRAMSGWTSIAIVPIGFLAKVAPQGYRLGLWVISAEAENRY
jgi:hypothetical protein